MNPAKRQGRGEDRDIALLQGIHRMLVAIEADELFVGRHIDEVAVLFLEVSMPRVEIVFEDIGHRGERDGAAFGGEGIVRRAAPAAAAADESDLDGVARRGVDMRDGDARECGGGGEGAGVLEEGATGGERGLLFVHKSIALTLKGRRPFNKSGIRPPRGAFELARRTRTLSSPAIAWLHDSKQTYAFLFPLHDVTFLRPRFVT